MVIFSKTVFSLKMEILLLTLVTPSKILNSSLICISLKALRALHPSSFANLDCLCMNAPTIETGPTLKYRQSLNLNLATSFTFCSPKYEDCKTVNFFFNLPLKASLTKSWKIFAPEIWIFHWWVKFWWQKHFRLYRLVHLKAKFKYR